MPLPTCSVRALPEHHHLLRRLARALASRPDLAPSVEALIADVTQAETQPSRPAAPGKRRPPTSITDDLRRQVHDLRTTGMSRDAIAVSLSISGSTVSKILNAPRPAN